MTVAVFVANAATDEAGNFIYFHDLTSGYYPPQTQYEDAWENNKMYETAPGSNIYETTFNAYMSYICFYYDLADGLPDGYSDAFRMNVIQPLSNNYGSINIAGNSNVYMATDVVKLPVSQNVGRWSLPSGGNYRLRLDLNEMKFYAIPEGTVLILVNDNSLPDLNRIADYTEFENINNYFLPGGDLTIRLYDLYNDKWLNPANDNRLSPIISACLEHTASDRIGEPYIIADWKGGVLRNGSKFYPDTYYLDILPDTVSEPTYKPISPEVVYVIGDFNYWNEFQPVTRQEGTDATYTIEFPSGTKDFKMLLNNIWGAAEIGSDGNVSVSGDNKVIGVRIAETGNLSNSSFASALTSPVTATLNLTKGTFTFPADTQIDIPKVMPEGSIPPVNRDALFVVTPYDSFTPWKGCSDAVLSSFQSLAKQSDGTYSGYITTPSGKFALHFISELNEKGTPNTVIAPPEGNDRELTFADGKAYSSAEILPADEARYWWGTNSLGLTVLATVTLGNSPSVEFDFGGIPANTSEIYLIGEPQYWDINDGSMPLKLTSNGGYYGAYDIAAGETTFRFYSALGDWERNSLGSGPVDNTAIVWDASDGQNFNYNFMIGKGSYNVINWPGGTMYMYLNPADMTVKLSSNPIPEAGEVGAPLTEKIYLYDNSGYTEMKKKNGLYTAQFWISSEYADLRLFTKKLPISPEEAQWAGSYALCSPDTEPLVFDDLDVAETTFVNQDYVTTEGGNPFRIKNPSGGKNSYYCDIAVDLENKKIYIERLDQAYYLCGGISDNKFPTYATREEFRKFRIPHSGGILDVPAGKLDFFFCKSIADGFQQGYETVNAVFNDGLAYSNNSFYGWAYQHVTSPDWQGGKLFISPASMLDMSTVDNIKAFTINSNDWNGVWTDMAQTTPGSLIFKGKVPFVENINPGLYFLLRENTVDYSTIQVTLNPNVEGNNRGEVPYNIDNINLIPENGTMTGKMAFNRPYSFSLPSLVGSGNMDVTVDLNTMTLTAVVAPENEGSVYEAVAGEGNTLDGVRAYPSTKQEGAVVLSTQIDDTTDENLGFNFTDSHGNVIIPASGTTTPVEFDSNGIWTGPFTKTAAPAAGRQAVRAAASQDAKWVLSMPEGKTGNVNMLIDETNNKLTIVSSAHNKGYFIINGQAKCGIEYIADMKRNLLTETGNGIYEGDIDIPENATEGYNIQLVSDSEGSIGIFTPLTTGIMSTFDLTGHDEASQGAYPADPYFYPNIWTIKAPAGNLHLRFDSKSRVLTANRGGAGVENVAADRDATISITPGEGRVTITTPAATHVDIHTVAGQLVKSIDIPAGTTVIDLPAGLYIVNHTKLLVR